MSTLNIINEVFDIFWLLSVLFFLWSIWRNGNRRTQREEQAILQHAQEAIDLTKVSVASTHLLAETLAKQSFPSPSPPDAGK